MAYFGVVWKAYFLFKLHCIQYGRLLTVKDFIDSSFTLVIVDASTKLCTASTYCNTVNFKRVRAQPLLLGGRKLDLNWYKLGESAFVLLRLKMTIHIWYAFRVSAVLSWKMSLSSWMGISTCLTNLRIASSYFLFPGKAVMTLQKVWSFFSLLSWSALSHF